MGPSWAKAMLEPGVGPAPQGADQHPGSRAGMWRVRTLDCLAETLGSTLGPGGQGAQGVSRASSVSSAAPLVSPSSVLLFRLMKSWAGLGANEAPASCRLTRL